MKATIQFAVAWQLVFALLVEPAAGQGNNAADLVDEAARSCPAGVDESDRSIAWWCGFDPATVVDDSDGTAQLTAFPEHPFVNIAAVPTNATRDLDWTCIDGVCGGLLDPEFIIDRELSHLWEPDEEDGQRLDMTEARWQRAIKGRNSWLLWTGGNHAFWDYLARHGYGLGDFLKLLDNRYISRADRFRLLGVINEPGTRAASGTASYGLEIDVPVGWEGPWPPPPGTPLPAETPDPYVYGYSSGIMGMRLFPNPDFFFGPEADAAQHDWDPERYLGDPNYAKDPRLIRPYRVGVACGFCHTSFNPINPPDDPAEPEWGNISASVGGQYLKFGQVAAFDLEPTNFLWHLVNFGKPGTVDTSLVATDGINNPNVVNGVFGLLPRMINSARFSETANAAAATQPVLDLSVFGLDLPSLPNQATRNVMRVLAGGEDSVGGRLALARVYLNIGLFHDYWRRTANLLVGVKPQSPLRLDMLAERSVYWNVSLYRTQNMAEYLTYASGPLKLLDAPGGDGHVTDDAQRLARGRGHFVTHCMVCHSTKQPEMFWSDPGDWARWVNDPGYLEAAVTLAEQDHFLTGNFLATDVRYTASEIGINIARFLSDNALENRVWQDFSSAEYKAQMTIDTPVMVAHPYDSEETITHRFDRDAGPGRVRPLSLINMWATAPYLHNNSVGGYPAGHNPGNYLTGEAADVSVTGRMNVFNRSIEELLHLRERQNYDSIIRTTADSRLEMPRVVLIEFIRQQLGQGWVLGLAIGLIAAAVLGVAFIFVGLLSLSRERLTRRVGGAIGIVLGLLLVVGVAELYLKPQHALGHIPSGTPVSLISNLNGPGWVDDRERQGLIRTIGWDLLKVWFLGLSTLDDERVPNLVDNLIELNKAPDFMLDRGHDFGGKDILAPDGQVILPALTETQRRELIDFLRTL